MVTRVPKKSKEKPLSSHKDYVSYQQKYTREMIRYFRNELVKVTRGEKTATFPTFEMFAYDIVRTTTANVEYWCGIHPEFNNAYNTCRAYQEQALITGGLNGTFNAAITKIMLAKYGYSDVPVAAKVESKEVSEKDVGLAIRELISKASPAELKEFGLVAEGTKNKGIH